MLPQLLYRRAINLSSTVSVIFDLAMNAILRELEGDKDNGDPLAIPVLQSRKCITQD